VVPATLGLAISLAVSGDALLRDGLGLAFPAWIAMTTASLLVLAWRADRHVPRETVGWLATAVMFASGLAWRSSEELQVYDFLATVGALVMAAASLSSTRAVLFAPRLRAIVSAAQGALRSIAGGFVPLVLRDAAARYDSNRWSTRARIALRVGLIIGALALVFGPLLSNADPIFASFVTLPHFDTASLVRHAIVIAILTWTLGGWARGALIDREEAPMHTIRLRLGALELTTAFVTLIVLFGGFVLAQLGWLFGGDAFLRARTGLTAAQYARQGFFQMVFVIALVIPLIVGTRVNIRPRSALAQLHSTLALPVVGLVAAIVASAALRMQLYVRYYGLSTDRLYTLVFMAWLAFVLGWLSFTILRDRPQRFGAGVVLSAITTLGGVNVMVPDLVVARVNVARANMGAVPLDVRYLTRLSGEATDIAVAAVLAANPQTRPATQPYSASDYRATRCSTIRDLLLRWGATSRAHVERTQRGAWRSWNAGEAHALDVVARHQAELDTSARDACTGVDTTSKPPAPVQR
jgi:hypothetical protein